MILALWITFWVLVASAVLVIAVSMALSLATANEDAPFPAWALLVGIAIGAALGWLAKVTWIAIVAAKAVGG
jgi:hypothetical protein